MTTLLERYLSVRGASDALVATLTPEDQQLQSMPDASPTKWHRAHTTWFFEEFVLAPRGQAPFDPSYRFLFNSYYDAVGARHPRAQRGLLSRPSADAIGAYRRSVDERMCALLQACDPVELGRLGPLVELGLAHEEQHQELILSDIVDALASHPSRPALRAEHLRVGLAASGSGVEGPLAPVPVSDGFDVHAGGIVTIGAAAADGFCFDNEGPRHRVFLEPFAIARRPISVREVRAFAADGGYSTPSLWLSDGWQRVRARSAVAPLRMSLEGGDARVFGVDGDRAALDDEPAAHLDYYEADAIARYLGGRLPTEFEWEHAARADAPRAGNFWSGGLDGGALRPLPGPSRGYFGDVWEWTSSSYAPYPAFEPSAGAVGEYNGKFMVSQYVLRGGSAWTPRGHVRPTYRNFWPPQTSFQLTGARVARSVR